MKKLMTILFLVLTTSLYAGKWTKCVVCGKSLYWEPITPPKNSKVVVLPVHKYCEKHIKK